jgi:hypothetical protein
MTVKEHLAELERQHKALEHEIADALAHSSTDDLKIAELKRRKLILKDEIERPRDGTKRDSRLIGSTDPSPIYRGVTSREKPALRLRP